MQLVRVLIYRSTDEKKFDTTKPYATVELGPEEKIKDKAPSAVAPVVTGPPPNSRISRTGGDKKDPKKIEVPPYAKTFLDKNVEQKKTYFYEVKLVGLFTSQEGYIE